MAALNFHLSVICLHESEKFSVKLLTEQRFSVVFPDNGVDYQEESDKTSKRNGERIKAMDMRKQPELKIVDVTD